MAQKCEIKSYELKSLLKQGQQDLMMDFRRSLYETFECAPSHADRTVGKLDLSYEGAFPEPWDMKYQHDGETILFSAEKLYDEIAEYAETSVFAINPSYDVFVNPRKNRELEVEIRGDLEMSTGSLKHLVNDF